MGTLPIKVQDIDGNWNLLFINALSCNLSNQVMILSGCDHDYEFGKGKTKDGKTYIVPAQEDGYKLRLHKDGMGKFAYLLAQPYELTEDEVELYKDELVAFQLQTEEHLAEMKESEMLALSKIKEKEIKGAMPDAGLKGSMSSTKTYKEKLLETHIHDENLKMNKKKLNTKLLESHSDDEDFKMNTKKKPRTELPIRPVVKTPSMDNLREKLQESAKRRQSESSKKVTLQLTKRKRNEDEAINFDTDEEMEEEFYQQQYGNKNEDVTECTVCDSGEHCKAHH